MRQEIDCIHIISFEGLASHKIGYVRNGLVNPIVDRWGKRLLGTGITLLHDNYAWDELELAKLQRFGSGKNPNTRYFFAGHSFGSYAASQLWEQFGEEEFCLLMDSRRPPTGIVGWSLKEDSSWVYNYYRTGILGLPGKVIEGAINKKLSCWVGHTSVPSQPEVAARADKMLEEYLKDELDRRNKHRAQGTYLSTFDVEKK